MLGVGKVGGYLREALHNTWPWVVEPLYYSLQRASKAASGASNIAHLDILFILGDELWDDWGHHVHCSLAPTVRPSQQLMRLNAFKPEEVSVQDTTEEVQVHGLQIIHDWLTATWSWLIHKTSRGQRRQLSYLQCERLPAILLQKTSLKKSQAHKHTPLYGRALPELLIREQFPIIHVHEEWRACLCTALTSYRTLTQAGSDSPLKKMYGSSL